MKTIMLTIVAAVAFCTRAQALDIEAVLAKPTADNPWYDDKQAWPDLVGDEYFTKLKWPKARLLIWKLDGAVKSGRGEANGLKPENWIDAATGKPADAPVDMNTDIILPDADNPYTVDLFSAKGSTMMLCRHVTIGRNATLRSGSGGHGKGLHVGGNMWIRSSEEEKEEEKGTSLIIVRSKSGSKQIRVRL